MITHLPNFDYIYINEVQVTCQVLEMLPVSSRVRIACRNDIVYFITCVSTFRIELSTAGKSSGEPQLVTRMKTTATKWPRAEAHNMIPCSRSIHI